MFVVTGCLGFLWLVAWRALYHLPEKHPRLSPEELAYIRSGTARAVELGVAPSWRTLLGYKQTWGIALSRFMLDPYWFFVADWFALYLSSKGFNLEQSILGFWVPFLGSDLGNFFGGGFSSWLVGRGWSVGRARRIVHWILGPSMLVLIPGAYSDNYWLIVSLFAYASFAYAACSTMQLAIPADAFQPRAVGSVAGLGGFGAGVGTLITTYLIGRITDQVSFQPIIIAASIIPCLSTAAFVGLVRDAEDDGVLRKL